jgi:hypothetical protein
MFTPPLGFLGLEISTVTAEDRWGLGFVYNISLITFKSIIDLSLSTLSFFL